MTVLGDLRDSLKELSVVFWKTDYSQLTCPFFPPAEQMDALFSQCFFHALKCKVKKSDLPLLTSTFLRSHMFSCWYVVRRLILLLHAGLLT